MTKFEVRDSLAVLARPRKLSDIIGNETNIKIISGMFARRELAKVWMIVGRSGTGKTTCGRLLGMVLNCQNLEGESINPCLTCPSCLAALKENHPDILEINASGEEGKVDNIRSVLDNIRTRPRYNFKLVLVDEAHGLGKAKNELLKHVEQPPKHVVWVFCTTEPEKLPEALFGRCIKLYFAHPTLLDTAKLLRRVSKKYLPDIADTLKPYLKSIAAAANSQPRNSIALLETVAAAIASDPNLGKKEVTKVIQSLVSTMGELDGDIVRFCCHLYKGKRLVPLNILRTIEPSRVQEFLLGVFRYSQYSALWHLHNLVEERFDTKGFWGINYMRINKALVSLGNVKDLDLRALRLCNASTAALEKVRLGLVNNEQAALYCFSEYFSRDGE